MFRPVFVDSPAAVDAASQSSSKNILAGAIPWLVCQERSGCRHQPAHRHDTVSGRHVSALTHQRPNQRTDPVQQALHTKQSSDTMAPVYFIKHCVEKGHLAQAAVDAASSKSLLTYLALQTAPTFSMILPVAVDPPHCTADGYPMCVISPIFGFRGDEFAPKNRATDAAILTAPRKTNPQLCAEGRMGSGVWAPKLQRTRKGRPA